MSNMLGRTGPFDTHSWKGRNYYANMTAKRMNEKRQWRKEANDDVEGELAERTIAPTLKVDEE